MPHIEIKCSSDIEIDSDAVFQTIETQVNQFDPSCGDCKSRFYRAEDYRHSHIKVDAHFLEKPNRDRQYIEAMLQIISDVIKPCIPKETWLSIEFHFSKYYITEKL